MSDERRYTFESPDDHIVVTDERGRKLLIDTGSPRTYGDVDPGWLNLESPIRVSSHGFDFTLLHEFLGMKIDGLVGTDVLGQVPFSIDWTTKVIEFNPAPPPEAAVTVLVELPHGVPVAGFTVAGKRVQGIVDTGAVISFFGVEPDSLPDPVGHRHEFVPRGIDSNGQVVFERFDTDLWPLPVEFGGRLFPEKFGKLPGRGRLSRSQADRSWILGAGLWKSHPVLFDLPQRRILVGDSTRT